MNFKLVPTKIPGCFEIIFKTFHDHRGTFTKIYHEAEFKELNIDMHVAEEFSTYSIKNVFRGLHFQKPPKELDKMVFCYLGEIMDYVVDLRIGSPTYGEWLSFNLSGTKPKSIFVPKGVAHGFLVLSDFALMHYKTSQIYDSVLDSGILYTSFSFANKIINPIISERDASFKSFKDFDSPFKF